MPRENIRLPDYYLDIEDVYGIIKREIPAFEESLVMLKHSLDRCKKINPEEKLTLIELEKLEALKNRYIRAAGTFLEVFLSFIDKMDQEENGTIIDRIKRAEKKQIVGKAHDLIVIRNLRADLERTYFPDGLNESFLRLMETAPKLFDCFDGFVGYAKSRKFYEEPGKPSLVPGSFLMD